MFFNFLKTISLLRSNTYFLRHPKYLPVIQGSQQTSATYIYRDIKLPGYKKSVKYRGVNILEQNITESKKQIRQKFQRLLQKILD